MVIKNRKRGRKSKSHVINKTRKGERLKAEETKLRK